MIRKYILVIIAIIVSIQLNFAQQSLMWAKGLDGGGSAGVSTISDASGNVINGGQFNGTVDFDPGPIIYTLSSIGAGDMYITKLDINGDFLWVKQMGGAGGVAGANSISSDASGNIYTTGTFAGIVDFDPAASSSTLASNGVYDCFVAKYDPNGNFIWARSVGNATATDVSYSVKTDPFNNVFIAGFFNGTVDFDPGNGFVYSTSVGLQDAFVLKLDMNGNFVWVRTAGSIFDDRANALQIDALGNIYSTGHISFNADFNPSGGGYSLTATAGTSTFIWKLSNAGNFVFASGLTGSGGSILGQSIALDNAGNILTTGFMNGPADFDPSVSSVTLAGAGSNDIFVSKLNSSGGYVWAKILSGTSLDLGYSITVDQNDNVYTTGTFQGIADFDPNGGTYTLSSAGSNDIFISKLDPNGNFLCAGKMGDIGDDRGLCVHIDAMGNLHNTGYFTSVVDFDPSPSSYTLSTSSLNSSYFTKYAKLLTGTPLSYTVCDGEPTTLAGLGANTYSWSPAAGLSSTTGNTVIATPSISTNYTVLGTGGCFNTSTVIAITVKPKPIFIAPSSPQTLICIPDSIILQSSTTNTNAILRWRFTSSPAYTNQPYYAKTPGNYYALATNTLNGCSDSSLIVVNNGKIPPNAKITSHTYVNALTPIDTVTCYQPTVNLVGASDTTGVVITWKSVGNNSVYPNPVSLTSLNNLKLFVKRNDNNCSDSSIIALVNQDNVLPTAIISNTNAQINCSIYTSTLSAIFSPNTCASLWNTPVSSTITNPSIVSSPGKYKLVITNPDNGCVKLDSVNVVQTNSIIVSVSNNFTVCKSSPVTLTAQAIGTLTGVGYLWSSGQNSNSINVSSSVTTNYIVTATSGTCVGSNTINVNIPTDIQDSIIAYRSCNDNTTGTILIFAKGGIAPYKYSINNGSTFFTSNSFTSIPFGTYNVVIKDTIGCLRQTTVSVSAGNSLPTPLFLASTKNYKSDTIVLVDVSIPKPDSVQWVLPSIATKIGGTMFSPVVVFSDTGNFVVTMKGFYGSCIINASKLVRFAPYDTLVANYNNASGIKTFSLYPNPNTGQFTVYVEFYNKQNATIQVWDVAPYKHYQQNFYDVISITLPVDVSFLQNGSYLLRVIAEYDARNRAFIISK